MQAIEKSDVCGVAIDEVGKFHGTRGKLVDACFSRPATQHGSNLRGTCCFPILQLP